MTAAREEILARIRSALGRPGEPGDPVGPGDRGGPGETGARPDDVPEVPEVPQVPRDYRRTGTGMGTAQLLDLFEDRLVDYRADVHRTSRADLGRTVRTLVGRLVPDGGRLLVPPGLPSDWLPADAAPAVTRDAGFDAATLDGFAAVVTGCAAAAAATGTIVLDGSPDQGRRAITLVPDVHLCVVEARQVVETVPELIAALQPGRPLTFVSGPSATSDIELERVEGVHGPRTLTVVLVVD